MRRLVVISLLSLDLLGCAHRPAPPNPEPSARPVASRPATPPAQLPSAFRKNPELLAAVIEALQSPLYPGKLKPRYRAHGDDVVVELPFVGDEGGGQYVAKAEMTYHRVVRTFSGTAIALFAATKLQRLTFVGVHFGREMIRVVIKRAEAAPLRKMQEALGAYQGRLMMLRLSNKLTEAEFLRKAVAKEREMYQRFLARLPKGRVTLHAALR